MVDAGVDSKVWFDGRRRCFRLSSKEKQWLASSVISLTTDSQFYFSAQLASSWSCVTLPLCRSTPDVKGLIVDNIIMTC